MGTRLEPEPEAWEPEPERRRRQEVAGEEDEIGCNARGEVREDVRGACGAVLRLVERLDVDAKGWERR